MSAPLCSSWWYVHCCFSLLNIQTHTRHIMSKAAADAIYTPSENCNFKTTPVDYRFSTSVDKSKVRNNQHYQPGRIFNAKLMHTGGMKCILIVVCACACVCVFVRSNAGLCTMSTCAAERSRELRLPSARHSMHVSHSKQQHTQHSTAHSMPPWRWLLTRKCTCGFVFVFSPNRC